MKQFGLAMVALGVVPLLLLAGTKDAGESAADKDKGLVTCKVELEKPVLPAEETTRTVVKITLDAERIPSSKKRPPINLAVVLDRSGSMSGNKLDNAKEAAIAAARRLDERDIFSLVVYGTSVETVVPAQTVDDIAALERRIRAIEASGSTNLFGGVNQGASEIRKHLSDKRYTPRIILLSDGLANVGPRSAVELGRLGAALVKEGVSVTTIGVGSDYNEDLMTELSQNSDGNTYFVETSRDLPRIFAAELGDVLSVVARNVTIEIVCPEGVRPVRIIGRDGKLRGQRAEVELNQLYGGQSKYVLVEVEVPATAADRTRDVASAHCTYESALDNQSGQSKGTATAHFSPNQQDILRNVNREVQTDYAANNNAIVTNQAVELADQGKASAAVQILIQRSSELEKQAKQYNNLDLHSQSAEMKYRAEKLKNEGMGKAMRKWFRADSYQTINQQGNR
jgi:Ca-activated chloride channel family protein